MAGSSLVGLLAVPIYTSGLLFIANTGRTIRLEPFLNAWLIAAFSLYFWRPESPRVRLVIGLLFGAAVMTKYVALLPIGFLVLGDLLWRRPNPRFVQLWALSAATGALVIVAVVGIVGYRELFEDTVRAHFERPDLPLRWRLEQFASACVRYPPIPIALAASVWLLLHARDHRLRIVSLIALGPVPLLVFAFRSSINFYFVQLLPGVTIIFAILAVTAARQLFKQSWAPLTALAIVFATAIAPIAYDEIYVRYGEEHTSGAAPIVARLKEGNGDIYAMFPSFGLASGRGLYRWHWTADSYLPRVTGLLSDENFIDALSNSESLVFWNGERHYLPISNTYIEANFEMVYSNQYWELWTRTSSSGSGTTAQP
jgi:hypothetical protein